MESFTIAISEKNKNEAIREISLKIKSSFPKSVKYILVFFTPHYKPADIYETLKFTLTPQLILGIQSPLLIFEDRIIEKGIAACCINKEGVLLKEFFTKTDDPQNMESALRAELRKFPKEKEFFLSFLTQQASFSNYLRAVTACMGKASNVVGAGFIKKYSAKNYQIIDSNNDEGILNIIAAGIKLESLKISGFKPLGKPFRITKTVKDRSLIMEINNEPAINIYKYYLEDKFNLFRKNHLFHLYPLAIIQEDNPPYLINIRQCMEDGSLLCIGEIKENCLAHIMLLNFPSLSASLKTDLAPIKKYGGGLIFMINSLSRKKILKDCAQEEIKLIKSYLGDEFKIIGIYADYLFCPDKEIRKLIMETGKLVLTLWN